MKSQTAKQARIQTEQAEREKREATLVELSPKILSDEIQDIAKKAGVARNTVVTYLGGAAPKRKTADKIIKAANSIISGRKSEAA